MPSNQPVSARVISAAHASHFLWTSSSKFGADQCGFAVLLDRTLHSLGLLTARRESVYRTVYRREGRRAIQPLLKLQPMRHEHETRPDHNTFFFKFRAGNAESQFKTVKPRYSFPGLFHCNCLNHKQFSESSKNKVSDYANPSVHWVKEYQSLVETGI